jgi:F0F1-type ATP synthase assembly protein I
VLPDPSFYARLGRLSAIVMILPASMLAGWLLGYLFDRLLGTFPVVAIIATLLGAAAGFYQIVRILMPRDRDSNAPPQA